MKTIIALTDFSDTSINAVNYAADMSCVIGTNLTLFNVVPLPQAINEVPSPAFNLDLQKENEDKIDALKDKTLFHTGGRISINTIVVMGEFIHELKEYCSANDIYAIVIGAESKSALERALVGGRTIEAVRKLEWPVIVVPEGIKFTGLLKIALACDLEDVVETIPIKEIKDIVNFSNAELHVLYAGIEKIDIDKRIEKTWLQDILAELKPVYHFIREEDEEKGIIEFTDKNDIDLLIIIPKKHRFFKNIFQKSHSKKLVLHSHVPIMAIHE